MGNCFTISNSTYYHKLNIVWNYLSCNNTNLIVYLYDIYGVERYCMKRAFNDIQLFDMYSNIQVNLKIVYFSNKKCILEGNFYNLNNYSSTKKNLEFNLTDIPIHKRRINGNRSEIKIKHNNRTLDYVYLRS